MSNYKAMALFIWLIIRLIQLVFSVGTVFFSHKKSANSVFQPWAMAPCCRGGGTSSVAVTHASSAAVSPLMPGPNDIEMSRFLKTYVKACVFRCPKRGNIFYIVTVTSNF
jgi:hypothetical protein